MTMLLETRQLEVQIALKQICKPLDWHIQPQEIWGILGQNGSGKTTLLWTLAGLLPPARGDIFLKTHNLKHMKRQHIAKELGILFQELPQDTFRQTVYEYCRAGRFPHLNPFSLESKQDKIIIAQALSDMHLEKNTHQLVSTLSGGERRRLNLATLLAQTPSLYLLDEPINHLDLRYQMNVMQHFVQLVKETTASVIMSLHDIRMAKKYCHKIILLLGAGEFLLGSPNEVLTIDNIERAYECVLDKDFLQM